MSSHHNGSLFCNNSERKELGRVSYSLLKFSNKQVASEQEFEHVTRNSKSFKYTKAHSGTTKGLHF